jgi:hypothetical protein
MGFTTLVRAMVALVAGVSVGMTGEALRAFLASAAGGTAACRLLEHFGVNRGACGEWTVRGMQDLWQSWHAGCYKARDLSRHLAAGVAQEHRRTGRRPILAPSERSSASWGRLSAERQRGREEAQVGSLPIARCGVEEEERSAE